MKTSKLLVLSTITLVLSLITVPTRAENACSNVDRTLSKERSTALGPVVAEQLKAKHAEISKSFRFGGWSILYASTGEADDAYVFYSADPMRNKYVTLWGGVALENEEQEIRNWALKNAPGIPRTLARCFAWHVTKER